MARARNLAVALAVIFLGVAPAVAAPVTIVALGDSLTAGYGLPPEESRANLDAILDKADARDLPVLLVPMIAPANYGPDYKASFDAIYPDLAARHGARLGTPFLGPILSMPDQAAALRDYMQPDGLHPSSAGVAIIVEALGPEVVALIDEANGKAP